jgi:hypothetical protein
MLPWLVPVSLIISFCIFEFGSIILRKISVTSKAAGISINAFSLIVFLIFFLVENVKLRNSIADASKKNWNISEMVSVIEDDIKSKRNYSLYNSINYLGVIPDHHYINGQTLRYYATLKLLPLNVIKVIQLQDGAYQEFVRKFDRYDYILTKDLFNSEIASFRTSIEGINKYFFSHLVSFELLKTFQEPDGSKVSIFKRKNLD